MTRPHTLDCDHVAPVEHGTQRARAQLGAGRTVAGGGATAPCGAGSTALRGEEAAVVEGNQHHAQTPDLLVTRQHANHPLNVIDDKPAKP